jgi:hypothetical protein
MQDVYLLSTIYMETTLELLPHRTQNMEVISGQHSGNLQLAKVKLKHFKERHRRCVHNTE